MQDEPIRYWQDLTDNYRQMSDGELLELAGKPEDLTDVAQQVLRDEMKKRRLSASKPADEPKISDQRAAVHWESKSYRYMERETPEDDDVPHEYTWKTLLCECESSDQAWQIGETLRLAGIESWVTGPASRWDLIGPRIEVAADQLERAQAVLAQPIPPEVIEDSQAEVPEFAAPLCPKCHAPDPILESADPVNAWMCEACGAEWTDSDAFADEDESGEESSAP